MLKVAFIGFGGIAKTAHLKPYLELEQAGKVRLVAACDIRTEAFENSEEINIGGGNASLRSDIKRYTDWKIMLSEQEVDLVDICVPTYLHADIAIEVLKAGYHVLCEKPMSLTYERCCDMIRAAKESDRKLMIGQCLRFGNKYQYLKKVVQEKTFGEVKTGCFRRLSGPPVWGYNNWFLEVGKSGGCVTDMHIHDIDIIRHIFGEPEVVSCTTQAVYCEGDIAHSILRYPAFTMMAIGDWSQEGLPFSADYRVSFEKATVDFSDNKLTVYPRDGEAFRPDLPDDDFYLNEIEYFVDNIESAANNNLNPPESAALSVKLANTLVESSKLRGEFVPFQP